MPEVQEEAHKIEGMASAFVHMDGTKPEARSLADKIFTETDDYLKANPNATRALQDQFNADRSANKYIPDIRVDEYSLMIRPAPDDKQTPTAVMMRSR